MLTKGVLFHQYEAPANTSVSVITTIQDCEYDPIPHPTYSPDISPFDFHRFPTRREPWVVTILIVIMVA